MSGTDCPPFFTVVIPTYRRREFLPRAVGSVLGQTFDDFELVIVDDASPDGTPAVLAGIRDPRVRVVQRAVNGGAGATRNTGIGVARGGWIAFLDDDDEFSPDFLAHTHEAVGSAPSEVGLSWCGVRWIRWEDDERRVLRESLWQPSFPSREDAYRSFLRSRRVGTNCGLVVRRAAWERIGGFDEALRGGAEDTDFLIRMVRQYEFLVVPHVLVEVNLHGGPNLRGVSLEKALDYEKIIAKNAPVLATDGGLAAELYYKCGWLSCQAGDFQRGRRHLLMALKRRPQHLRSWSALLLYQALRPQAATATHRALSRLHRRRAPLSNAPEL